MAIRKLNEKHLALTFGSFAAIIHAAWAVIVAAGYGQTLVDWLKGLHFVDKMITVTAFNWVTAAMLIIVTFICGAIFGWLFAEVWNWTSKSKRRLW